MLFDRGLIKKLLMPQAHRNTLNDKRGIISAPSMPYRASHGHEEKAETKITPGAGWAHYQ